MNYLSSISFLIQENYFETLNCKSVLFLSKISNTAFAKKVHCKPEQTLKKSLGLLLHWLKLKD